MLSDLNVCSQKGLVEMFDGSIGAGSVFMPYGGKYQLTETQSMVAKLPVAKGKCDAVTMMSYGFDPYLGARIMEQSMQCLNPWQGLWRRAAITGRSALPSRSISAG